MKIQEYEIKSENKDKVYTEILFHLASCRAGGEEFAFFSLSQDKSECALSVERFLKGLKQSSKIDFYLKSEELLNTTAGSYLENKHPQIITLLSGRAGLYIVKL